MDFSRSWRQLVKMLTHWPSRFDINMFRKITPPMHERVSSEMCFVCAKCSILTFIFSGVVVKRLACNVGSENVLLSRPRVPAHMTGVGSMESIINKLKVPLLRARLAMRQSACISLARQYESVNLTIEQKNTIGQCWEDALKDSRVLLFMLQLVENLHSA